MIKIDIKKHGSLDKALKHYKFKVRKLHIHDELRERTEYKKDSVKKREALLKAKFIEKKRNENLD